MIEHFCASSGVASVLGIDVTFNLGRFYVTLCTYQNLNICNNRGKHPIMVGPALVQPISIYFFKILQNTGLH